MATAKFFSRRVLTEYSRLAVRVMMGCDTSEGRGGLCGYSQDTGVSIYPSRRFHFMGTEGDLTVF